MSYDIQLSTEEFLRIAPGLEDHMGGPGPFGDPFEEDEVLLARRYPNLWRRFGAAPLIDP